VVCLGRKIKVTPDQFDAIVFLKEKFYGPGNPEAGSRLFWFQLRMLLLAEGLIEKG